MAITRFVTHTDTQLPVYGSVGRNGWYAGGSTKTVAGAKRAARAALTGYNDDGMDYVVAVQPALQEGYYTWFAKQI